MTELQFKAKVEAARKTGRAIMPYNTELIYYGPGSWAVHEKDGQTVDTAFLATQLYYLYK